MLVITLSISLVFPPLEFVRGVSRSSRKIVRTVLRRILPRALTVENELKPRVGADALAKFMYPELTLVTAFFVRRWLPSVYRIDLKLPTLDSRTMILVVLEQLV